MLRAILQDPADHQRQADSPQAASLLGAVVRASRALVPRSGAAASIHPACRRLRTSAVSPFCFCSLLELSSPPSCCVCVRSVFGVLRRLLIVLLTVYRIKPMCAAFSAAFAAFSDPNNTRQAPDLVADVMLVVPREFCTI